MEACVFERLQPYRLDRMGRALLWMNRLASHRSQGGAAALGIHVRDVRVGPARAARRLGVTIDPLRARGAIMGEGGRLVLARVRCPSTQIAANALDQLQLHLTASVEVANPQPARAIGIPLIERMALVEDFLYLTAARLAPAVGGDGAGSVTCGNG